MLLFALIHFVAYLYVIEAQNWECSKCRTVVNHFIDGVRRTETKNFGGGNTLWEQEKLGSYSTSETRLNDIMENICTDSSLKESECHNFVGDYEHAFEEWWTSTYRDDPNTLLKIEEHLCVNIMNVCCPPGSYGPMCRPCSPCNVAGGRCDGNGTRTGSGKCICLDGYMGHSCEACNLDTHYSSGEADDASLTCNKCHNACVGGCSGPGTHSCHKCANGWSREGSDCVDVNECDTVTCPSGQFCVNTAGSYICQACDQSCESCNGSTSGNCIKCSAGYQRAEGGLCEDINECSADSNVCQGVGERCINTPGSYLCECMPGFEKSSGSCKPVVTKTQPDTSSSVDDVHAKEGLIDTIKTEDASLSLETYKSEL